MKTIHIHIYKAKQGVTGIATGENGIVLNENHIVKLPYDTMEWHNYLKTLQPNGIIKVDVLGFYKSTNEDGSFAYDDCGEEVEKAVHTALYGKEDRPLSKDEEIALLKKQVGELIAHNKKPKEATKAAPAKETKPDATPNVNEELEAARDRYKEIFGKKPHHMKKLESINEEINAKS